MFSFLKECLNALMKKMPKKEFNKLDKLNVCIPTINRDGSLMSRLFPIAVFGVDNCLDKKSGLYLRLLCKTIDKSYD